jgi:uncharacterized protein YkwD
MTFAPCPATCAGPLSLVSYSPLSSPPASSRRSSRPRSRRAPLRRWRPKSSAGINQSRVNLGLVPLRSHAGLRSLATYRAGVITSTGVLSHTIAGCLSCELNSRGIQWYSYGECIAWTSSSWGSQAAWAIFDWWRQSSTHWAILMSRTFNYIGIGVAYRSSNATTWSSLVLTESVDQTRPTVHMRYGSDSATTVSWGWRGGRRAPPDPHRGAQELRRRVPRRLRDMERHPQRDDFDLAVPGESTGWPLLLASRPVPGLAGQRLVLDDLDTGVGPLTVS